MTAEQHPSDAVPESEKVIGDSESRKSGDHTSATNELSKGSTGNGTATDEKRYLTGLKLFLVFLSVPLFLSRYYP
jgi:hypothetical protein